MLNAVLFPPPYTKDALKLKTSLEWAQTWFLSWKQHF